MVYSFYISELGLIEKEEDLAFYQKQTDTTYIVWFGKGVGESLIYRSSTKKWISEG